MKNKVLTLIACTGLLTGAMTLMKTEVSQAQTAPSSGTTFVTNDTAPAIRAAYSTVSVGGAAHSVALEVIYPKSITPGIADGSTATDYTLALTWAKGASTSTTEVDPNNTILETATLSTSALSSDSSYFGALQNAITKATDDKNFAAVSTMIEKFVGPNGAQVKLD